MYDKIVITGSVGAGKTTISKILGERLRHKVIHITDYVKENDLVLREEDGELIARA